MVPLAFSLASEALILPSSAVVALAHADADRADRDRLVAVDEPHLGEAALLQIVGEDRIVGVAGLEAAGVHVAQDVGNGVVGLDVGEQAGLLQRIDEGRADLGADRLALQIVLRGVGLGVALRHHEAFAIGVDRVGEIDDLLARRVMNIAAAMMSILLEVSDGISAENGIGSICTLRPASLPISVTRSTMMPWMVLVLVSRKVKGMPVGVEPTFSTCCAEAGTLRQSRAPRPRPDQNASSHPPLGPADGGARTCRDPDVAGRAVSAYFHQYENLVTLSRTMQAVFMHMKEAV